MLCFFIALFFAVGSAFGFTESSDFVFSHSITNPISNNPNTQFGYGIAIGQSGLEMYAADFASAKLYYFIRSAHSASFVQSYALPIPVYGTSYPITADDELTVMVYVSNKTLVIYNLAEEGLRKSLSLVNSQQHQQLFLETGNGSSWGDQAEMLALGNSKYIERVLCPGARISQESKYRPSPGTRDSEPL